VNLIIRPFIDQDLDEIVALSLLAWEPVFESFKQILGPKIYTHLYPDWRKSQKSGVESICKNQERIHVLVAETDGKVVGFLAYELSVPENKAEVQLLAVHPEHQNLGIGTDLNITALQEMKAAGMTIAIVETGGDDSHAPARRSYEKAEYTPLPISRYFKNL
jgi:ribosomal protein S18 acetylase RimI-like enzyme